MRMLNLTLKDTQFPFQGIREVRPNARALLMRPDGKFAFQHILATDRFGHRDYIETPGGGIDPGETPEQAVIREVEEECGLTSVIDMPIGMVKDAYHLIHRENHNYYFFLKVTGVGQKQWTPQEHRLIHALHWLTLQEAFTWYERLPNQGIAQLIKQRELPVIQWLIHWFHEAKNK